MNNYQGQPGLEPGPPNFQEPVPSCVPFAHSFSLILNPANIYGIPTAPRGMGTQPRVKPNPCLLELRSSKSQRQETDRVASVYCESGAGMYFSSKKNKTRIGN